MKYLYIILLFLLLGCSKDNQTKVDYYVSHSGDGVLFYKFDNQIDFKQVSNNVIDTSFIVYDNGYDLRFEIFYDCATKTQSEVEFKILVNNEIVKEKQIHLSGCSRYRGQLYYSQKQW